jgi:hypothetical protein
MTPMENLIRNSLALQTQVESERYDRIVEAYAADHEPYTWHSITCVCETCLDTDAVATVFQLTSFYDVKGLVTANGR